MHTLTLHLFIMATASIRPSETYARMLLPLGHGYPLWIPEPNNALPEEYQVEGVRIGDVGVVNSHGAFVFLFNICLEKEHPINQWNGVPEGFLPVQLNPWQIHTVTNMHRPSVPICSTGVEHFQLSAEAAAQIPGVPLGAGGGIELKFSHSRGAVLMLPEGASRADYLNLDGFRKYAAKNAPLWYQFVNGTLGLEAGCSSLYLLTGYDKSACWEAAEFSHPSKDQSFSIQFTAGLSNSGRLTLSHSSLLRSPVSSRCSDPSNNLNNQSVFIRGFKITLRQGLRDRLRGSTSVKVMNILGEKPDHVIRRGRLRTLQSRESGSNTATVSDNRVSHLNYRSDEYDVSSSAHIGDIDDSVDRTSNAGSDGSSDEENPYNIYHPSSVLNDYMLDMHSDIDVAITHDTEWYSLLEKPGDTMMPAENELMKRARERYQVDSTDGELKSVLPKAVHDDFSPAFNSQGWLRLAPKASQIPSNMGPHESVPSEPRQEAVVDKTNERTGFKGYSEPGNAHRSARTTSMVGGMNRIPPGTRVWYWNARGAVQHGTVLNSQVKGDRTQILNIRDDNGSNLQLPAAAVEKVKGEQE
ncbi:hypothetical protein D9758_005429 [Tetrapyrgos nigripes]|uniref:Uncharacterized protein n=1 Tax=Tetrapyrgos nigripes TaxID=182062 RepID=A0A8H5LQ07_9AGAR|nr:hypothetical protein D9758_005429 [Tetrapyrgos nigripes]